MKIVCTSDTHRMHGMLKMPKGDILIHAGDFTDWGSTSDMVDFKDWLREQDYKHKFFIAGNHDVKFEIIPDYCKSIFKGVATYLDSDVVEVEGLKIFGTPYTPRFAGAFQLGFSSGEDDRAFWNTIIPDGIDILVTHGPPLGILDIVERINDVDGKPDIEHCGSLGLLERVAEVKPKLHLFGHIHQSYGTKKSDYGTKFVNAAAQDFVKGILNKPIVVEVKKTSIVPKKEIEILES